MFPFPKINHPLRVPAADRRCNILKRSPHVHEAYSLCILSQSLAAAIRHATSKDCSLCMQGTTLTL